MDAFRCIATKLDIREFSHKRVPADVKLKVLEAARLTGSGLNSQHWRFILVQNRSNLKRLAQDSTTGKWVANADFAMIVLTNPKYGFHLIDAGRVLQNMQVTAWNYGVLSCVYTGISKEALKKDFNIPKELETTAVVGFGYPVRKIFGRKSRKPLSELAFMERFDNKFEVRAIAS